MTVRGRLVALVGGGREAALVARVRVHREVERDHLSERAGFGIVGLLGVEVEQKPPQAVAPPTLGGDVAIHPRAGVAHRREVRQRSRFSWS
jgi:hypothetical protein